MSYQMTCHVLADIPYFRRPGHNLFNNNVKDYTFAFYTYSNTCAKMVGIVLYQLTILLSDRCN